MRIVVVGGAGFVGSALCRTLLAEHGATVLNIDKLTATSSLASLQPISASPRYKFRRADICDRERLTALLQAFDPEAIIHAAAERRFNGQIGGAADAFQTNALGTWRLLEATRDFWEKLPPSRQERFRFVSVSSKAEASDPAAAIRAGADEVVAAWHKSYGLPTIVSRAAATFGPYQFPGEPVPSRIVSALRGVEQCPAESGTENELLHVSDHVNAILAMIRKGTPGATYTVSGNASIEDEALATYLRELVEQHLARSGRGAADGLLRGVRASVASLPAAKSARLEHDTGWKLQMTIESALASTVAWYTANEAWWRPLEAAEAAGQDRCLLRIA